MHKVDTSRSEGNQVGALKGVVASLPVEVSSVDPVKVPEHECPSRVEGDRIRKRTVDGLRVGELVDPVGGLWIINNVDMVDNDGWC